MAQADAKELIFDNGLVTEYAPDLYHYDGIANYVDDLDSITDDHIDLFNEQGYLAVKQAFTGAEVNEALVGLLHLLSGEAPDFNGVMYEQAAAGVDVSALSPEEKQDYVRKFMWFVNYDERLHAMAYHPKLLTILERIMHESPVLFQDMALLKPPRIGREKPWHQDHAYFELSLEAKVVGCWIALDEATTENGCMIIIPGSHRQGPVVHFKRRDWQICDTDVKNQGAVAVPLPPGGCLLFSSLIHHGTPTNHSTQRRRAVQYHYRPESAPKTSAEERLAVFGEEGKDVTC
jgi:phytanoyl-CoA hydroxylase